MYSHNINVRVIIFILCFIATIITGQRRNSEQAICNIYNIPEIRWTCKEITSCRWAVNIVNTHNEHRCGSNKHVSKICCPEMTNSTPVISRPRPRPTTTTSKPTTIPPRPIPPKTSNTQHYIKIINKKCDDYAEARYYNVCKGGTVFGQVEKCNRIIDCVETTYGLIVGGVSARPKEFPHMALVGYGDNINQISWACGGSLISERFVLSAAHCTSTDSSYGSAKWLALGILSRKEAVPERFNKNIFRIIKTYNHPGYKASLAYHDIALYQLQNPVQFTPYMRPICLHTMYDIPADYIDQATITGWGLIDAGFDVSDNLLKATIHFLPHSSCIMTYEKEQKFKNGFNSETMVCAGDEYNRKDTCQGDSGGPLQIAQKEKCMYTQVGITSIGSSFCGDNTPAVYTRVSAYLEWIQKIVWPNGV